MINERDIPTFAGISLIDIQAHATLSFKNPQSSYQNTRCFPFPPMLIFHVTLTSVDTGEMQSDVNRYRPVHLSKRERVHKSLIYPFSAAGSGVGYWEIMAFVRVNTRSAVFWGFENAESA